MLPITHTIKRETKYCQAIKQSLRASGHATNTELLSRINKIYPNVSATTIHRVTARLAERGEIKTAPATREGAMRYDSNLIPHDHFLCLSCDRLRDIDIMTKVVPILEVAIHNCSVQGRITVSGFCHNCKLKK